MLGGRLLRGLRDDGHRLPLRAAWASVRGTRSPGFIARRHALSGGGIIGTNHHLYFADTPTAALAWGATLSAFEVVPLVLIGYQAMKDLKISRRSEWARKYRWPIYFFIAVGFWNLVGAGIFGFMINPPHCRPTASGRKGCSGSPSGR